MQKDYIANLPNDIKLSFFKIFCLMVKSDGTVDSTELEFIKEKAATYGIDNNTAVTIIKNINGLDYIAEARKITDRKVALELVKELCILANIDNNLNDNELDMIIRVAHAMNIEDEKIILINRWVLDSIIVMRTGNIILEQNNE